MCHRDGGGSRYCRTFHSPVEGTPPQASHSTTVCMCVRAQEYVCVFICAESMFVCAEEYVCVCMCMGIITEETLMKTLPVHSANRCEYIPLGGLPPYKVPPPYKEQITNMSFVLRLHYMHSSADLVGCPGVAKETGREVRDVAGNLLDHQLPHLVVPDCLRRVKLAQEGLAELLSSCTANTVW